MESPAGIEETWSGSIACRLIVLSLTFNSPVTAVNCPTYSLTVVGY